jgi:hypothetical protein
VLPLTTANTLLPVPGPVRKLTVVVVRTMSPVEKPPGTRVGVRVGVRVGFEHPQAVDGSSFVRV